MADRAERSVLVTGFEPFGGEPVNPSQQLVERLDALVVRRRDIRITTSVLPVDRTRVPAALDEAVARIRPDLVVLVGQATGRGHVDLESRAHNAIDFRGATDNGGHSASGEPLEPDGPDALDSRLALAALADRLRAAGLPVALSVDAGRHLCNASLYTMLRRHPQVGAVFVHVPLLPEQAERRGTGEPSLPLERSEVCLHAIIEQLVDSLDSYDAPTHSHSDRNT